MIRPIAAAILAAVAVPALAAEQSFPVGGFDRIALGGSPDVTVTTGKAVSVRASGEQQALDRLDIRVEGGVLKIGTKRGDWNWSWRDHGKVSIAVTVPMVRGVELGGSGTVSVDRIRVPAFTAEVGGSGAIRVAALDAQTAKFSLAGFGQRRCRRALRRRRHQRRGLGAPAPGRPALRHADRQHRRLG